MDAYHIVIIVFFWNQLIVGCEQKVLVWNLKQLSANASTTSLVATALMAPCALLQDRSFWAKARLTAALMPYAFAIANHGAEIENGNPEKNMQPTYGKGNVINKLLAHMTTYCPSEPFTGKDTFNFVNFAVEPQMYEENIRLAALIRTLAKSRIVSIGISNQDPLEYQIYAKKMAALDCPPHELFRAIIGVSLESANELENPLPKALKKFVIAPDHYPSKAFLKTIQETAAKTAPSARIILIDTEQPVGIENYGIEYTPLEKFLSELRLPNS